MTKLKALIITYYWPPAGGSGVQRWLKFVKYLPQFGVEPIVYTVDNANYVVTDASLIKEVPASVNIIKQPIWEPNNILSFFLKKKDKQSAGFLQPNPSFLGKVMHYIRANYFIPDARKFWIKPSVTYLTKYLEKHRVEVLITSGPPHSLHLIGLELQKKTGIKWISDFRDPWVDIDYFHQLPLSKVAKKKHQNLEEKVVTTSDAVIVVGHTMKTNYMPYNKNISVITNGFDDEVLQVNSNLDTKFTITHIGMMNADRNPKKLWKVLSEICKENDDFQKDLVIKLIGKLSEEVQKSLSNYKEINTEIIDYLEHKEVVLHQNSSQILLLVVNNVPSSKGIITGKIFEYLHAKRPILCIGPKQGDAAEIINNTQSGFVFDYDDESNLKHLLLDMYAKYKQKNLKVNSKNVNQYHRKELTEKLSILIKEIVQY